jgi:3-hydroxyacyl-CoA dehydrogenase
VGRPELSEVHTIAVIGAGSMGRSIAQAAALGGFRTILEDILPTALRKAEEAIRGELSRAVAAGNTLQSDADDALARIEFAASVSRSLRSSWYSTSFVRRRPSWFRIPSRKALRNSPR